MFSINVLLYGDNSKLAARCLGSIQAKMDPSLVSDVRIGMNGCEEATWDVVLSVAKSLSVPCHVYSEKESGRNVLKYPLMRRMLYDPQRPISASRVMWFDDDSFVHNRKGVRWLTEIDDLWWKHKTVLMGSAYLPKYPWNEHEQAAIKRQPWYTGEPLNIKPMFMTGGWWAADLEFLAKWDYPVRELKHNGGDVLLGEICRQQKAKMTGNKVTVAINYDEARGGESRAIRRGVTTPRPFEAPPPYNYDHHNFDVVVDSY